MDVISGCLFKRLLRRYTRRGSALRSQTWDVNPGDVDLYITAHVHDGGVCGDLRPRPFTFSTLSSGRFTHGHVYGNGNRF